MRDAPKMGIKNLNHCLRIQGGWSEGQRQWTDEEWTKNGQRTDERLTKDRRRTEEGRTKDGQRTDKGLTKDIHRTDKLYFFFFAKTNICSSAKQRT